MSILTGKVLSVETRNLGEPLTVAAAIGATSLSVEDATTFDENGGAVTIDGESYSYSGITVEPDTLILTAATTVALEEGVKVDVFPSAPIKVALVSLDDGGDTIPATVPHTLLEKFVDGLRDSSQAESVTIERRGNYEYVLADSVAEPLAQTSLDYVEGAFGVGLTEQVTQLQDATVLGSVGANSVSAQSFDISGVDLVETLDSKPLGIIRNVTRWSALGGGKNAGDTTGTTELRVFTIACGDLKAGRLYRIRLHGHLQATVAAGATDAYDMRVRYTTDGTTPTTASAVFPGGVKRVNLPASGTTIVSDDFDSSVEFAPSADASYNLALTLQRVVGAGVGRIFVQQEGRQFQFTLEDCGLAAGALAPEALQQTAYTDGSGSDNTPVRTYTTTWLATRTDTYVGVYNDTQGPLATNDDLSVEVGYDDTIYGPSSAFPGAKPNWSLVYFNTADILAKLASSVSISSVKVTFRGLYRASSSGIDLNIGTHTYSSAGGAYNWNTEVAASRVVGGVAKANVAPGSTYTVEIGTSALGALFKSGARRGIVFYTPTLSSVGAGRLYYYPHASRPSLTITYTAP